MINLTKSKKGFLSIYWVGVLLLVTSALMITATYSFSTYAGTPTPILMDRFTAHYYAEFGIMCGKAMLDSGFRNNPGNGNEAVATINPNGRNVDINIRCTSEPNNEFTITSTDNTSPGSTIALQADWRTSPNRIEQIY